MSEYQEEAGLNLAGVVFVGTLLLVSPLVYAYLLALRILTADTLAAAPAVPSPLLALGVAGLPYLSRRIRRTGWLLRVLPVGLGLAVAVVSPPSLPLLSPRVGLQVHRSLAEAGALSLAVPSLLHAFAAGAAVSFVPAAFLRKRRRSRVPTVAHGSARWGEEREARKAGLLAAPGEGVHLGYLDSRFRQALTDASDHHVLVFAPPGVGKTTALVIPTLLRMRSSAWVLDPKGELWDSTAAWRSEELEHDCIRFAPTDRGSPRWNPLLEIPLGPGDVAAASLLARNLVVSSAAGAESHWTRGARSLFVLLALHVCWEKDLLPTMATLRGVLSSDTDHEGLFRGLAGHGHDSGLRQGWRDATTGRPSATHPEVALLAWKFAATPGRERGSIVSTLAQYLDPWGDPQIARATAESDLDLGKLVDGRTTLYLSIPFHDLGRLSGLIRLQLAALGRRLTERPVERASRLEVVVDEFASLGRVPVLEELLAYFRGYSARCFLLCQDLAQIHRLYGREETITGNCRVHVTTATQSPGTRKHASSLAGATTARYRRVSRSHGGWKGAGRRTSSMVEASRPLITEGEVGTLELDRGLVFKAGMPPLKTYLRPYFRDPELVRRTRRGVEAPGPGSRGSER